MAAPSPRVFAIVPAAGSGARMRSAVPKLLLPLAGCAVIHHTIRALSGAAVERIVIPVHAAHQAAFEALFAGGLPSVTVVLGGASRAESVRKGLAALAAEAEEDDLVLVHDGARCLVDVELIRRTIAAALELGAVTAAVPSVDSIKRVNAGGRVEASLERTGLWCVQTPQVFRMGLLLQAHAAGDADATDDASLVERVHPVHVVPGSRLNLKVTTPEDYQLARALLAERARRNSAVPLQAEERGPAGSVDPG